MIIVGGTYFERVVVPDSDYLIGSGVRAAAALANIDSPPLLYTATDADTEAEAELVASALKVNRLTVGRSEPVGFRYMTPLSAPSVNGPAAKLDDPIVPPSDATVLCFGLVERGDVNIEGKTVVLDPQKPRDTGPLTFTSITADRIIVVANRSETRQLGGIDKIFANDERVHGVVTKRAAAGCTVAWRSDGEVRTEDLGAHPTDRVWPIGSGDTFSAALAHALDSGADLVDAARVASAAAAHWCATRSMSLPAALFSGDAGSLPAPLPPSRPLIYLAAPFFTVSERWLVELVRDALFGLGVSVFSPLHDVGEGGDEVAEADIEGLRRCDAVLALLDGSDPGTVFEVGWAVRERIPTVGYASLLNEEVVKMMAGTAVELHRDLSTACYRSAWAGMGLRPRRGWVT
jgi:nucleoside 2-deoxyribosyltransferase